MQKLQDFLAVRHYILSQLFHTRYAYVIFKSAIKRNNTLTMYLKHASTSSVHLKGNSDDSLLHWHEISQETDYENQDILTLLSPITWVQPKKKTWIKPLLLGPLCLVKNHLLQNTYSNFLYSLYVKRCRAPRCAPCIEPSSKQIQSERNSEFQVPWLKSLPNSSSITFCNSFFIPC